MKTKNQVKKCTKYRKKKIVNVKSRSLTLIPPDQIPQPHFRKRQICLESRTTDEQGLPTHCLLRLLLLLGLRRWQATRIRWHWHGSGRRSNRTSACTRSSRAAPGGCAREGVDERTGVAIDDDSAGEDGVAAAATLRQNSARGEH